MTRMPTNNQMELTGVIEALAYLRPRPEAVAVYTDSTYVIRGITAWVWNWRKRDWKTAEGGDVVNRDLWEILVELVSQRGKTKVQWHHVRGHSGIPGNERVDEIATTFALARQPQFCREGRHRAHHLRNHSRCVLLVGSSGDVPAHSAARSEDRAQSRRRPGRLPGHCAQGLSPRLLR